MSVWLPAFVGLLAGMIGWAGSSFVGKPLRSFFDLRGEIIQRIIEFANVRARYNVDEEEVDPPLSADEIARLDEKKRVIRDLAARMRAFAENEPVAVWVVTRLGYDLANASTGLFGLSNTADRYGPDKKFHEQTLERALKIGP
jgi:hypothetical protein